MTIIAYRDGVMAADTATYMSHQSFRVPGTTQKIYRLADGSLFGGAGATLEIQTIHTWLEGDRSTALPTGGDSICLWVRPDGRVQIIDGKYVEDSEGPFYAIGSGGAAALGAMYQGATAEEAARIACLVDPWCDGEIRVERLDSAAAAPFERLAGGLLVPRGIANGGQR